MLKYSAVFAILAACIYSTQSVHRVNYGAAEYDRIIDQFRIISEPKAESPINLSVQYPGGVRNFEFV